MMGDISSVRTRGRLGIGGSKTRFISYRTFKLSIMPNSKKWYINKGFSEKMASYFSSGRKKVIKVTPNRNLSISLVFNDNEKKIYNMLPLIKKGTVFEKLSDWNIFKKVYIDTDGNVCWNKDPFVDSEKNWNNKIDLSADLLYVDSILDKNI